MKLLWICPNCRGESRVQSSECLTCGGRGYIWSPEWAYTNYATYVGNGTYWQNVPQYIRFFT